MADSTSINLRLDKELKKEAEELFAQLGLNMSSAINMFLKQSVREQAIPFQVKAYSVDEIPAYRGGADKYARYADYIADSLRQSELRVAEGKMEYFTGEEILEGLERVLNEKIQRKV